jgi:ankyrin repeat protein
LACKNGYREILEYLLKDTPELINVTDNKVNKAYPLHYAVIAKSEECTSFLLGFQAQINVQDQYGNTPLHYAVINKDFNILAILVKYRPDINIRNYVNFLLF